MSGRKRRIKNFVAATVAVVCLMSLRAAAQEPGPQGKQGTVSDDDFISLHQQIKELKDPTFRAFLTIRLLSWESAEASATRRQAAMEVATQGVTDLCEHQAEIWTPTASWLYEGFVKQIKTLRSSEDTPVEICKLKSEPTNKSARDLSSGIKMLSDPETNAAGLNLAKSAILSGQVPAETILGQLLRLQASHSPHLSELLSAVLSLEEKQPGWLRLQIMPFFSPVFFEKSTPPEISTRFLFVAVRTIRMSDEQLGDPMVRSSVIALLNVIAGPAKRLTPALYIEIASRVGALTIPGQNSTEARVAADERIDKASDQLEQLIAEAKSASDKRLKEHFFFRAARLAKEKGQLSKGVDLAINVASDSDAWLNEFLFEIVSLGIKRKSPRDAAYAISKMTRPLERARAFSLLGEYYGENHENVKSREAFEQSARLLKLVDSNNEKVRVSLSLAESVLKYDPADAYEIFREAVKAINKLPSPEQDNEKIGYVKLMPVAEDLIRSFSVLATRENQTAINLASEIKLSELRLSALSGTYRIH